MNVRDVAHLARIRLTDAEAEAYQQQLNQVLGHVEQLESVDVEGIEPTALAAPLFDVMRDDAATTPSLPRDVVLGNAPDTAQDQIRMPKVLD